MKETLRTSDRILREAARLFAERGFGGTSIEDIGAACGTSGPAIYKHFPNKNAILAQMLLDISRQLVEGGRSVAGEPGDAAASMVALIRFHAAFAVSQPDLIRVQDRDLASLNSADSRNVRRMQREYVEVWVNLLQKIDPTLTADLARLRAHATFGLLNSTPHAGSSDVSCAELIRMSERALGLSFRADKAERLPAT
jgi:AcrR family transcriptional regulator